jgi:hypothetical protein
MSIQKIYANIYLPNAGSSKYAQSIKHTSTSFSVFSSNLPFHPAPLLLIPFLAYFPYFQTIIAGLCNRHAVCVSVYPPPHQLLNA